MKALQEEVDTAKDSRSALQAQLNQLTGAQVLLYEAR